MLRWESKLHEWKINDIILISKRELVNEKRDIENIVRLVTNNKRETKQARENIINHDGYTH